MTHEDLNVRSQYAEFKNRTACIACGGDEFNTLWAGHFNQEPVKSHLLRCFYSGEAIGKIGNESFQFVQCRSCAQLFHLRVLTPDWLQVLYNQWIDNSQIERFEANYIEHSNQHRFERARQLVKHMLRLHKLLRLNSGPLRLLDYGCGDGTFLAVASLFGYESYGVDFSLTRTEQGRHRGIKILADLNGLDALSVGHIHAATLFQVLEHVEEPLQLLLDLRSRMTAGAILIVEVPDCRGVKDGTSWEDFGKINVLEHINAFTPTTLRNMVIRAGFELAPKPPAHVTTRLVHIVKTALSGFIRAPTTAMYFRTRNK